MRTYTREQVAQVVEGVAKETLFGTAQYPASFIAGARDVLRRLDALPSTPAPSPARGVTEGFLGMLESEAASVRVDGDGVSPDSHSHQLRILMFRFPDGSLAPYVEATEGAPYAGECLMPLAELVHLMRNVGHMEAFQIGNRAAPNPPAGPESPQPSILDAFTMLGRALRANSGGIHTMVTLEVSGDHFDTVARGLADHVYSRLGECIHCETGEVPIRVVRAPRPRATTPTPEVPPYAKQDGTRRAALTRLHEGLDPLPTGALASSEPAPEVPALKAKCEYGNHCWADGAMDCMCGKMESREPSAPAVVWTGDGVRVLADGTVWDKYAPLRISRECAAIARALAEAKRPTTFDRQKYEDACARLDEAMRLGAESMRERAAKVADTEQEEAEKRRAESVAAGHTRTIVLAEEQSLIATRIADDIRALPLEEP